MAEFHHIIYSILYILNTLFYSRFLTKKKKKKSTQVVMHYCLGLYQGTINVCTSVPAWSPSLSGNETPHMELHEVSVEIWGPYRDCPEGRRHTVSLLQSDGEVFPVASTREKSWGAKKTRRGKEEYR